MTNPINQASLDRVDALLTDLKTRASAAQEAGDVFVMGVYVEIISVVSPIVRKAHNRLERENLAAIRKARKEMRTAVKQNEGDSTRPENEI